MTDLRAAPGTDPTIAVTDGLEDREWDRFLEQAPGGHHVQTSMWSRVKAVAGWRPVRVTARRGDQVVGGAQILVRPIGRFGNVGYISQGPVASERSIADAVMSRAEEVARELHIHHLTVQTPLPTPGLVTPTPHGLYLEGPSTIAPGATILLDVTVGTDELLAGMQRKTRYNVRLSGRRGVTVRVGGATDIPLYHDMVRATAARRNFTPFPLRYYEEMWDAFGATGHLRLAVAEYEGEPIASQIAIGFGSTVVNKLSVWSGRAGAVRPNEAIQWSAISWAAEAGYSTYDLEGIDVEAAKLLAAGASLPSSYDQTTTSFKLGFGGRVVVAPPAQEYLHNRATRWAYGTIYPRVRSHRLVKRARKRLRSGGAA